MRGKKIWKLTAWQVKEKREAAEMEVLIKRYKKGEEATFLQIIAYEAEETDSFHPVQFLGTEAGNPEDDFFNQAGDQKWTIKGGIKSRWKLIWMS